ncbi:MAG: low molecular weight protein-tyrosine-phosphatase [Chlamydiota bacterium]
MSKIPSILFVCSGNICRSPALKEMMKHLLREKGIDAYVESCGLHTLFPGRSPDKRMQTVGKSYGIALHDRSKPFEADFFNRFDVIFCVTGDIRIAVKAMARTEKDRNKVFIASHFSKKHKDEEIPDPYVGGEKSFEAVWNRVADACRGIIRHFFVDHPS